MARPRRCRCRPCESRWRGRRSRVRPAVREISVAESDRPMPAMVTSLRRRRWRGRAFRRVWSQFVAKEAAIPVVEEGHRAVGRETGGKASRGFAQDRAGDIAEVELLRLRNWQPDEFDKLGIGMGDAFDPVRDHRSVGDEEACIEPARQMWRRDSAGQEERWPIRGRKPRPTKSRQPSGTG